MKLSRRASSPKRKHRSSSGSFISKLRKRKIIETLAAFIGGGWLILEFVHWILIDHYHFPEKTLDITFITLICALVCTLSWLWFRGIKKLRRFRIELFLIPLLILITAYIDVRLILSMREHEIEALGEAKWKNSIAVLPFVNISGDEEQEYFCDGLTEELINKLSNLRELKVAARTSAFAFKGEKIVISEVGQKLKVDRVLEGSVRKAQNQLRVTVQLINVSDGYHIWSQQYDRKLEDVFAIQDEISLAIADKLRLDLLGEEKGRLIKRHSENLEAHNLYLQGRFFWNKRTGEDMKKSLKYYEQAIEKDSAYALAYVGLADAYVTLFGWHVLPPMEALPKAKKAAIKALKIDDTLAEAYASLAVIKECYERDWQGAETEFMRAIELNPNYANAHFFYAQYLIELGRFDEAITEIKLAQEIDPLSLNISAFWGWLFYMTGEYEKGIEQCQITLEMDPRFNPTHLNLGLIYQQKGMYEKALTEFEKVNSQVNIGITYAKMNRLKEAQQVLIDLMEQSKDYYIPKSSIALLYFALGEDDPGFEWLERAYEEGDAELMYLKIYPLFDSVRSDSRFKSLLKRMGLE